MNIQEHHIALPIQTCGRSLAKGWTHLLWDARKKKSCEVEVMRVSSHVPRSQMENDSDDVEVDAKWVVTPKETPSALSFKASLVACEFAAR